MLGFNNLFSLAGHVVPSPRKQRTDIEEVVEEIKRGTGEKKENE